MYIKASELTNEQLDDLEAGALKPWRIDADGVQWFRTIEGVPPGPFDANSNCEFYIEGEDGEMELVAQDDDDELHDDDDGTE